MHQKLARLLAEIDPSQVIDGTARRIDEAINTASARASRVTEWEPFRQCIVDFGRHLDAAVFRVSDMPRMDLDEGWGYYSKVLHRAYGPNGEKAAFEYARTGVEGGLYGVLKHFAEAQLKELSGNEIRSRIAAFWNELSTDEKLAVMDEYIAEYGDFLPSEMTEKGAARLKMDFPRVLAEHPYMVKRLRDLR